MRQWSTWVLAVLAVVLLGGTVFAEIVGKVVEGDRPQAQLPVRLYDAKGKQVAQTTTDDKGDFTFKDLAPGLYAVCSYKTASRSECIKPVEVKAGAKTEVILTLFK